MAGIALPFCAARRPAKEDCPLGRRSKEPRLKIIPLGGLGEIGKNLTVYEYQNDIVVVDLGSIFPRARTCPASIW